MSSSRRYIQKHKQYKKIEKVTPFKRYVTKAIGRTSKFTEDIVKIRQITSCMPKTAVSPNFKAQQGQNDKHCRDKTSEKNYTKKIIIVCR